MLTRVLRHAVNSQMSVNPPLAVEQDQRPARSARCEDVVAALRRRTTARFHMIEFEGDAGIEALDRERADAAQAEILRQYAIPHDRKL